MKRHTFTREIIMDNEKQLAERKGKISKMNREDLETQYMYLFGLSLQKTQMIMKYERDKKAEPLGKD